MVTFFACNWPRTGVHLVSTLFPIRQLPRAKENKLGLPGVESAVRPAALWSAGMHHAATHAVSSANISWDISSSARVDLMVVYLRQVETRVL